MGRFHTILFDADNTLLDFTRSEEEALRDCLRERGLPHETQVVRTYAAINDAHWKMLERGLITRSELYVRRFEVFLHHFGWTQVDAAHLSDAYTDALATKSYLMEGAYELCRRLAPTCRLYLITNGQTKVQKGRFEPSAIRPFFLKSFISEEIGFPKPEKAFFNAVKASIPNFDASEALIVGDSLTSDIQGGIDSGIPTCWYNRKGNLPPPDMPIDWIVARLSQVADIVLGEETQCNE